MFIKFYAQCFPCNNGKKQTRWRDTVERYVVALNIFPQAITFPYIKQTFFTYSYKEHYTVALPRPSASPSSSPPPPSKPPCPQGECRGWGRVWLFCMLVCVSVTGVQAALTLALSGYKSQCPLCLALNIAPQKTSLPSSLRTHRQVVPFSLLFP